MPKGVEVIGADRCARTLHDAADAIRDLSKAHRDAAERVAATTRQRSRRRTGRLAASFTVTIADDGASVGSGLVYAGVQEFGGYHNIRPSYALTGALDANVATVASIYESAVKAAIGKVQGK